MSKKSKGETIKYTDFPGEEAKNPSSRSDSNNLDICDIDISEEKAQRQRTLRILPW